MTATVPSVPARPATPGQALDLDAIDPRWNGTCNCEDQEAHGPECRQGHGPGCDPDCYSRYGCADRLVAEVRRLRGQAGTYAEGAAYAYGSAADIVRDLGIGAGPAQRALHEAADLLDARSAEVARCITAAGPLSTAPPAGTEGDRAE